MKLIPGMSYSNLKKSEAENPHKELHEKISQLKPGEEHHFGNFYIKYKGRHGSGEKTYVLFDKRTNERSRWGNKKQILEDVTHAATYGALPGGKEGRW